MQAIARIFVFDSPTFPPGLTLDQKVLQRPVERALEYIGVLYDIEASIRGKPAAERLRIRQEKARPLLQIYEAWLRAKLETLSSKSDTAKAINYLLNQWSALTLYCEDGTLEIDNNIAENALRCVSLGRKNFLFAGSDSGGERAAAMYALIRLAH